VTNDRRNALIALTAAGVLWGLTVPLTKLALGWLDPAWLTVARFALAAPLLALASRRRLRAALAPAVVAWGAVGYGVVIVIQNMGIERTSVSHAALIVGAVPALVALFTVARGRGDAGPGAWLGFGLALGGVALVAGEGGGAASGAGDALVLGSVVLSAAYISVQPRLLAGRDPVAVTAVQLGAGALAALPAAILAEGAPAAPATAGLPAVVLGLATLGTIGPFTLFAWGQARVSAELAGAFVNLEPLVGGLSGALAFGDVFGAPQLAGGVLLVTGIAVSVRPRGGAVHTSQTQAIPHFGAGRPVGACPHDDRHVSPLPFKPEPARDGLTLRSRGGRPRAPPARRLPRRVGLVS
jgi:O-acetylserine/cysteine efflux transporter